MPPSQEEIPFSFSFKYFSSHFFTFSPKAIYFPYCLFTPHPNPLGLKNTLWVLFWIGGRKKTVEKGICCALKSFADAQFEFERSEQSSTEMNVQCSLHYLSTKRVITKKKKPSKQLYWDVEWKNRFVLFNLEFQQLWTVFNIIKHQHQNHIRIINILWPRIRDINYAKYYGTMALGRLGKIWKLKIEG